MIETRDTFCRICESMCGLNVEVEVDDEVGVDDEVEVDDEVDGGREQITRIRPNTEHVATDGFACLKGLNQHKLYDSPDRLEYPEKRIGDRWERISWDQAISEIGANPVVSKWSFLQVPNPIKRLRVVSVSVSQSLGNDHTRSINAKMKFLPATSAVISALGGGPFSFAHNR